MGETVTALDLAEHLRWVSCDAMVNRPFAALWNATAVISFRVETGDVRRLARLMLDSDSKFIDSRIAIAAPKLLVFGMSRILQALTETGQVHIEVLRGVEAAREWLRRD